MSLYSTFIYGRRALGPYIDRGGYFADYINLSSATCLIPISV
jgi:hypothetical protein